VPVIVTPEGEWVQDSSVITERLESRFADAPVIPAAPVQRFASYLLELWADEFWLPAGVHARWSFPENFPKWRDEMAAGFAPWMPRRLRNALTTPLKRFMQDASLGATPSQIPQIGRWLDGQLDALDAHFATLPFMFGTRPGLADFALAGPILGHLVYDDRSRRLLVETRVHLDAWVKRMLDPEPLTGAFLEGDRVPDTLQPLLRSAFDEMVPYLEAVLADVRDMRPKLALGERFPRIGRPVVSPLAGGSFERRALAYALWMTHRVKDTLQQMTSQDAAAVRAWVHACGGNRLLQMDIPRLRRVGLRAAPELEPVLRRS
jgi:glutathione S-transferase